MGIVQEDSSGVHINLGELSRYNGLSEFENMKMIVELLAIKAEVYDIPLKVGISFPKVESFKKES